MVGQRGVWISTGCGQSWDREVCGSPQYAVSGGTERCVDPHRLAADCIPGGQRPDPKMDNCFLLHRQPRKPHITLKHLFYTAVPTATTAATAIITNVTTITTGAAAIATAGAAAIATTGAAAIATAGAAAIATTGAAAIATAGAAAIATTGAATIATTGAATIATAGAAATATNTATEHPRVSGRIRDTTASVASLGSLAGSEILQQVWHH